MSASVPLAKIRACAREGISLQGAAARLGIPYPTLRTRAWRLGVKFQPHYGTNPASRDKIIAAIQAGAETAPQIAVATGIIRSRVSVILNQAEDRGLVTRVRGARAGQNGLPPIRWRLPDAETGL